MAEIGAVPDVNWAQALVYVDPDHVVLTTDMPELRFEPLKARLLASYLERGADQIDADAMAAQGKVLDETAGAASVMPPQAFERTASAVDGLLRSTKNDLEEHRQHIAATMKDIGMRTGDTLQLAGSLIGALMGHAFNHGVRPMAWVEPMMVVLDGEHMPLEFVKSCPGFLSSVEGVARSLVRMARTCVVHDHPDPTTALRRYLTLVAATLESAFTQMTSHRD